MAADQMEAGWRDQGRELLDELLGLEDDLGRAIAPAGVEHALLRPSAGVLVPSSPTVAVRRVKSGG